MGNKILSLADDWVLKVQQGLIIAATLALAFLMVAEVVLRYWIMKPILGFEEITILMGAWIYFVGSSYAAKQRVYIKGGVASLVLKNHPAALAGINLAAVLLTIIATVAFGYLSASYSYFILSHHRMSSYLRWPMFLWVLSMPVGFCLTIPYLLRDVRDRWAEFLHVRRR